MLSLVNATAAVNVNPAETWPAWTDEERWELGPDDSGDFEPPTPEDVQWRAEQNESWDNIDAPEPEWDALAAEREAEDKVCSGCYAW